MNPKPGILDKVIIIGFIITLLFYGFCSVKALLIQNKENNSTEQSSAELETISPVSSNLNTLDTANPTSSDATDKNSQTQKSSSLQKSDISNQSNKSDDESDDD